MSTTPIRSLSLFDAICIIVGIIIGVGIFESAPLIASSMGSKNGTLLIWLAGGGIALMGALCYAELATAYPREGGDYVYLTEAYGPWAGFLFGWSQLAIVRPGDIALLSFVFGSYAQVLFGGSIVLYASGAVLALSAINILGVTQGKWTQNILTLIKIAGLIAIVVAGLTAEAAPVAVGAPPSFKGLQLALILVLFTFGGWHEMAYVAAEIRNPERNILKGLLIGVVVVTALYLLVNFAFLQALGYEGMSASKAVAVDAMAARFPSGAARGIAVLICLSALGAVNGLILAGARVSYAVGADHAPFKVIGRWHPKLGTPVGALMLQGGIALAIVLLAGSFVKTLLYTAPVAWLFFLATATTVFRLRMKNPDLHRPYRVHAYPVPVILFALSALFMLYNCIAYAVREDMHYALVAIVAVLALGDWVYAWRKR